MPRKSTYRRKQVRRTMKKRSTRRRKLTNVPEWASCSETRSLVASTVNQIYSMMDIQLSDYLRASIIAEGYSQFRITNVKLRVKPSFDTFQNTGNAYQKPYFYYQLDKTAAIPTSINLEGLKAMGAKPRVLDEKPITVSWKPTVLLSTATLVPATTTVSKPMTAPWLSTDATPLSAAFSPSSVSHLGIYWGAFAGLTGQADPITYDVEMEIQFQFKKPLVPRAINSPPAIAAAYAVLNDSSDGVVGGPDGY